MLSEKTRKRLAANRPMTSITLRIPVDIVDALKALAPQRGFQGYQTLLKLYLSEGLRRDEARLAAGREKRLIEALKKRGVSEKLLREAEHEAA